MNSIETRRRFLLGGATALGAAAGVGSARGASGDGGSGAAERCEGGGDERTAVTACSFNVRYDNPDDEHSWDERLSRVVGTVERHRPALLGVQEAQSHQYDDLRGELDGYGWYGVGRRDGEREGEFVPIAWRADRFEAIETGAFWLSPTPEEPSVGWDADLPRVSTWASLRDRETGERFWHCNTHFDHRGKRARLESARLIRRRAADRANGRATVVVTGDFNATPGSDPYDALTRGRGGTGRPLVDARRAADAAEGPRETFHGFTGELDGRIDYVFVSTGVTVRRYRTLPVRAGAYRSDHLPVFATFEP